MSYQNCLSNLSDEELERQIAYEAATEFECVKSDLDTLRCDVESEIVKQRKSLPDVIAKPKDTKVHCRCADQDDDSRFITNGRDGDIVCKECGMIIASDSLYEGDWTRNFEGEEDTSQSGAAFNPLMSASFNLKTGIISPSGKTTKYQRMQSNIEMNLSKTGRDDKETRTEYKDKMKVKARFDIERIARQLDLSDSIIDLAHRYFCFYRDSKSKVSDMRKREAQCLVLALREKRREGLSAFKTYGKGTSFMCSRCNLSFATKLDVANHECESVVKEKKEVELKKHDIMPSSKLFKKPILKNEVDQLMHIKEKTR